MRIYVGIPYGLPPSVDYGKACREFVECVPDDAWVCIMDHDAMHTTPDWYQLMVAVTDNADGYSLLAPVVNGSPCDPQKAGPEGHSIDEHMHYGSDRMRQYGAVIRQAPDSSIPGTMFLFRKADWVRAGLAADDDVPRWYGYDTVMAGRLSSIGMCGFMDGLYLYHAYNATALRGGRDYQAYYEHMNSRGKAW